MKFETARFHAMGTEVELLAAPSLAADVVNNVSADFEAVEACLSRFRPESELSRLNAAAGCPFQASHLLRDVLGEALAAADESDGLFDPVLLHAVEAAGYRESIEHVRGTVQVQTLVRERVSHRNVTIEGGVVLLPEGSGIDLGGFAKGWTVDRAAERMSCCQSWVINAGGDLLARGGGPDGDGWVVGIEDPFALGHDLAVLRLTGAALATSTTMRRRWTTQYGVAHHLIDPRTQRPSESDLVSVSVIAPTAARAEVLAKTLLLRGSDEALHYAESQDLSALLIDEQGLVTATRGMEQHLVV
jgi:thiamine biosynthesis lipoprotein